MTISFDSTVKKLVAGQLYFFELFGQTKFDVVADDIADSVNYSFEICGTYVFGGKTKVLIQPDFVVIQLLPIHFCDINNIQSQIFMYDNSPCIVNLYGDNLRVQYKEININKKLINNKINNLKINYKNNNNFNNCKNNSNINNNNFNINENTENKYKINIFDKKIKNNLLLFICLENNIKKYYIILNNSNILFNNYLKEININDNLIVLDDNTNCLGEKTVFEFNLENNSAKKYAVEYKSKIPPNDVAVKFLDATKVRNQKLFRECLSLEIDIEAVQEFLGEFDDFLKIEDCYILLNNFEITKAIKLEIVDNKICNIYD